MKRVLLVTNSFPPQKTGRAIQVARRVKYLKRFGWQSIVLAPALLPAQAEVDKLYPEMSKSKIQRTPYLFMKRWPSLNHIEDRSIPLNNSKPSQLVDFLSVSKGYIRWLPFAIMSGLKATHSADVILTMNNPVMLHLIGLILHQLTGKPWAAEFRDPLVGYAYSKRGPEWINRRLESVIVHKADRIIRLQDFVPDPICVRYPRIPANKFVTIPFVGYDPDDVVPSNAQQTDSLTLQIAYTGSFYGNTITPLPFLRGLKQFLSDTPVLPEVFRIVFVGDWDTQYDDVLDDFGLRRYVKYLGYLTLQECVRLWHQSQVLLLILGKEQDNLMRIPSKFWDYLGTQRSILALAPPDGKVAQLVREQRLGWVVDTEDENAIATALKQLWQAHQCNQLKPQPSTKFLTQTKRVNSEKLIAEILNDLARQR